MGARYRSWVENLNQDWCISRQRFFGVPFPVWYPIDEQTERIRYDEPIVAEEAALPVDPQSDVPPGFTADQRGMPGGFVGDPDVMDTWATSSLSPQIAGRWEEDPDLFGRLFPMDLRPQAHDIIRTWLFYTVFRSELEFGTLPWSDAAISGFVLDPDRKKMSKSKGNVVVPHEVFERHSSDAVRYWAGSARLGIDAAFDEKQMKDGRRLAIKILNASKFALGMDTEPAEPATPLDRSMLATLRGVVREVTEAFEAYEHARALSMLERFFWGFTDDFLELVKPRAYAGGSAGGSAVGALRTALDALLRAFAPFQPYVTEEVWSWWREGSVHRAAWPLEDELAVSDGADPEVYEVAAAVLGAVRKEKALAKVSLRVPATLVTVHDAAGHLAKLALADDDVRQAGNIVELRTVEDAAFGVAVVLADVLPD
jgi:valyl-tRNA synthetase